MNASPKGISTGEGIATLPFAHHHAVIIGIDAYERIAPLQTPCNDAIRLAEVLAKSHQFRVHPLLLNVSGAELRRLLHETLPPLVGPDDRLLIYFAGHGIAADGDNGPAGYIVPADADPNDVSTFIPMTELQQALHALPCRHLLLILDCCFSGAFKWSAQVRSLGLLMPKLIYKERYDRFVLDPAWQVLTSAARDQEALDVLQGRPVDERGQVDSSDGREHSPFAQALFEGLDGKADSLIEQEHEGDGIITATELYTYIRNRVEPQTIAVRESRRQTPGFFPLSKHDKGEFVFLHPKHRRNLPSTPSRSPYMGLASFSDSEEDRALFYGRDRVIEALLTKSNENKLLVVSGASGTGKSSVVKAGLLPVLRAAGYPILPVMRPGEHPLDELERFVAQADPSVNPKGAILVIDQFEELVTRCTDPRQRERFEIRLKQLLEDDRTIDRVILTVRADFEPQLSGGALKDAWLKGRYTVPSFSLPELKEVIVLPTIQQVLFFEPPELVDRIVEEVAQSTGALPLLSYTLSELYEAYRSSGRVDRALTEADYDKLGGVRGALRTKANALYESLAPPEQETMRKIMLRMVSVEGDFAAKRVSLTDLVYSEEEAPRVADVIDTLVDARLVAKGEGYIEPAHDALVRAWGTVRQWVDEAGKDRLILGAKVNEAASDFARTKDDYYLWNSNPDLPAAQQALKEPTHWFNAGEGLFIRRSVDRRKRRFRNGITAAILIGIVLIATAITAWVQRGDAVEQAREAEAATREAQAATAKEKAATLEAEAAARKEQIAATKEKKATEQAQEATREQELATDRARTERDQALISQSRFLANRSASLQDEGKLEAGLALAKEALPNLAKRSDRPLVMAALGEAQRALLARRLKLLLAPRSGQVVSADFTPDGQELHTSSTSGEVEAWSAETGRFLRVMGTTPNSTSMAHEVSPDGKYVVIGSFDGTFQLRQASARTGRDQLSWTEPSRGVIAHFSPDSKYLVWCSKTGGSTGVITLDTLQAGETPILHLAKAPGQLSHCFFSSKGNYFARITNYSVEVFRTDSWSIVRSIKTERDNSGFLRKAVFTPDERRIVALDNGIRTWQVGDDRDNGQPIAKPPDLFDAPFSDIAISTDGSNLAASYLDTIYILELATGAYRGQKLKAGSGDITGMVYSQDNRWFLTGSADGQVVLWRKGDYKRALTLDSGAKVRAVSFSVKSDKILAVNDSAPAIAWSVEPFLAERVLTSRNSFARENHAPSRQRSSLAQGSSGELLWDTSGNVPKSWSPEHGHQILGTPSDEGTLVLTKDEAGIPFINYLTRGSRLRRLEIQQAYDIDRLLRGTIFFGAIARGLNPTTLATHGSQEVDLWAVDDGHHIRRLAKPIQGMLVSSVAYSPDGKRIIVAFNDGRLQVYESATGASQEVVMPDAEHVKAQPHRAVLSKGGVLVSNLSDGNIWIRAGHRSRFIKVSDDGSAGYEFLNEEQFYYKSKDQLTIYDLKGNSSGEPIALQTSNKTAVRSGFLLVPTKTGTVKVIRAVDTRLVGEYGARLSEVNFVDVTEDGKLLLVGYMEGIVEIFDIESAVRLAVFNLLGSPPTLAQLAPDRRHLLTVSMDRVVRWWTYWPDSGSAIAAVNQVDRYCFSKRELNENALGGLVRAPCSPAIGITRVAQP